MATNDGGPATDHIRIVAAALNGVLACEQAHPRIAQSSNEELADAACEIADAVMARIANRQDADDRWKRLAKRHERESGNPEWCAMLRREKGIGLHE